MTYVRSLAMLNKTFAFSNAVSHKLFKNKNKNIRFLMEEILGNEKLKTCISQDPQQADSVNHPARSHDRRKWLIYWFSNLLFQENRSIYKVFSLFKLIGLVCHVWLMLLLKELIHLFSSICLPFAVSYSTHESEQYSRMEWSESCVCSVCFLLLLVCCVLVFGLFKEMKCRRPILMVNIIEQ